MSVPLIKITSGNNNLPDRLQIQLGQGSVFWFTGLSGAGKTTLGKSFYNELKKLHHAVVFLDGDELRKIMGEDLGFSMADRKKCALRYSRICKCLSEQGIDVVCTTISMFHEVREWNRKNIENYIEIYIRVPKGILINRNSRNIYKNELGESCDNVVGIDLPFEEPLAPDVIIANDGAHDAKEVVSQLVNVFKFK